MYRTNSMATSRELNYHDWIIIIIVLLFAPFHFDCDSRFCERGRARQAIIGNPAGTLTGHAKIKICLNNSLLSSGSSIFYGDLKSEPFSDLSAMFFSKLQALQRQMIVFEFEMRQTPLCSDTRIFYSSPEQQHTSKYKLL